MSAQRVLDVARSQIGTVERPRNSNLTPYGAAYGMDGVAWCAMFVWWVFREAGEGPLIPKTAWTPAFAQWFQDRGQWTDEPRPGAVVFFDFPGDGVNRISHVGIVEAVRPDGTVTTIEGNTSGGTSGSQREGGGVWRRNRRAGIVGYGLPSYVSTIEPPGDAMSANEVWNTPIDDAFTAPPGDRMPAAVALAWATAHAAFARQDAAAALATVQRIEKKVDQLLAHDA